MFFLNETTHFYSNVTVTTLMHMYMLVGNTWNESDSDNLMVDLPIETSTNDSLNFTK